MALDTSVDPSCCPFGRRAIEQILHDQLCRTASHLLSTASTNQVGLTETFSDSRGVGTDLYPRLIVADRQTAGRGRQGRAWYSDRGTLTFSFVDSLQNLGLADTAVPIVALAVGMAVGDAVESFVAPYRIRLKWPNDLYAGGGKIGGVLVESATVPPRRLVIGIGINVATDLTRASAEVHSKARSLTALTGRSLHRYDLLPLVVECLADRLQQLRTQTPRLLDEYRRRCLLTGQNVRFAGPQGEQKGRVLGVDDSGALRIQTADGVEAVRSGEVMLEWKPDW